MTHGVVIVGAGVAGAEAARSLRRGGYKDPVRLLGREPYPPYDRPPLSKKFIQQEMVPDRLYLKPRQSYADEAIDLVTGCAVAEVDAAARSLRLSDGAILRYDACVLATGARPRRLPVPGASLVGIHVIRDIDDAAALRKVFLPGSSLVVVGGGYLGLEVASSARKSGLSVAVIEGAPALLQRSASALTSARIADRHRNAGTRILFDTTVTEFRGNGRVTSVETSGGESIAADLVLVAVGAEAEIGLARGAGLHCDNGIVVDEACRSSAADIYAVGDCAVQRHPVHGCYMRLEAINSALLQARSAAAAILGAPLPPPKPTLFWSEQYDARLQILGVPDPAQGCDDRFDGDDSAFSVHRFQNGVLVAVEAVNRPTDIIHAQGLIGRSERFQTV